MNKQEIKEAKMNEAIKSGLQSFREATASTVDTKGFDDPALYSVPTANGVRTATIPAPVSTGNQANVASITAKPSDAVGSPAGSAASEDEETVRESEEEVQISTAEYLSDLLDGDELTEEFMDKITVIFETALSDRIAHVEARMQDTFTHALTERVSELTDDFAEKLDEFLGYVVKEWTDNNEIAIERGIKSDIAESLITGLKDLFEAHYIEMPDGKIDVVEQLYASRDELEAQLNEQIDANVVLSNEINESQKMMVFHNQASNLTDTEVERFSQLCESITYNSIEEYDNKLSIIKESFLNGNSDESNSEMSRVVSRPISNDLTETTHQTETYDPIVESYSKAIGWQTRND
tara:strand:- start:76 stop:1128 length:1053 start_codon:yes stop_codon:yes gene_type:complete